MRACTTSVESAAGGLMVTGGLASSPVEEMASISASQRGRVRFVPDLRGWEGLLSRWPRSGTSSSNLQGTFCLARVSWEQVGSWWAKRGYGAYFCLCEDRVYVVVGHCERVNIGGVGKVIVCCGCSKM